ncbi:aldose 1-epimerase family protein [Blastococcus mobilis]|uniref:Aldose 1-epimerase n=1 Tax=Blastococcus mobilis TaxID=1938746 RepID=A0A238XTX1_9ACTN|nr:aldose 1-epimerase family protein [Blastococcus mobilis]SNR61893.1 aldose 1-epimerase [Blastococcus mobilis]
MAQHSWPSTEPTEVVLSAGAARLAVDLRGGGMRSLTVAGWEVLAGYPAGTVVEGWPGAVLLPWPNRIRDGRWTWKGRELQLEVGSPEEPHAIHGLVAWQPWTAIDASADTVTVATVVEPHPGYPFRIAGAVDYRLGGDRLAVTVRVRNPGPDPAPFGVGMHPYLSVGATRDGGIGDADLNLPVRTVLDLDNGLPTGERGPFDGAIGRIGDRALDDAFSDLVRDDDGWARVGLRGTAGELELAVDESWPWLQVFSGDVLPEGRRRRSLAVEPMTCPPNALADGVDLLVLQPGADWSGTWTLSWTAA